MVAFENVAFVFVAGLLTALATGLGAIPFFLVEEFSDRWNVVLWGLASGIMVAASLFGLVREGLAYGGALLLLPGVLAGVLLVEGADRVLDDVDHNPKQFEQADFKKLLLILGILTVHSFPEGVAVGVSFAELGLDGVTPGETLLVAGTAVPLLAVFMTIAISIHNIPEGTAIAIPLRSLGISEWRMVWWAVFSSLPQPLGAVIAYYFVTLAKQFLPFGFGFAAGAMVYLVATEFVPEALEYGESLQGGGKRELVAGVATGALSMIPLALV
ncbi:MULTISPECIES: ZIP family metal transporter [Haloarcula]|uniref:ZIP family metal transporter n=1 Tax=Haloarcula pellucida TaxID=1427151 RepID=A0A830GK28_9EURY|nr:MULTISPECIES: ZIP family metal transporter [Halomicroarcula]MBX0348871.1 ZIP family metal transporter [Halomicroarcula pellucida]MDS0278634.1 ZIP family metal transporter [Halomicroarcula sp. S1AR25-4]GGN91442.1 ZIP family metal transporter [Halomicroarcula pellucida]